MPYLITLLFTVWSINSAAKTDLVGIGVAELSFQGKGVSDSASDSWNGFLRKFQDAVRRRDKESLKKMMAGEFTYTFGPTPEGDMRDNAFKYWDDPEVKGWSRLDSVLAKGIVVDRRTSRPVTRVAPPAAKSDRYLGWRAAFELGDDRQWKWVSFVTGD